MPMVCPFGIDNTTNTVTGQFHTERFHPPTRASILPMVLALADRGHNITMVSPYKGKASDFRPNFHDLYSVALADLAESYYGIDRVSERLQNKHMKLWSGYHDAVVESCNVILNSPHDPVLNYIVHEAKFDLIVNNLVLGDCGLILAYKLQAKLIVCASTSWYSWLYDEFGFPDESSWIPDVSEEFEYPLGMWDRFKNSGLSLYWYFKRRFELFPQLEKLMKETYNLEYAQVPSLLQVEKNASLIFVLSHYTTDFARSLPPMVVNIGGMQCLEKYEPLTGEFKEHLDKATNGAVLIAFGSTINAATMPEHFKTFFFEMIESFPEITFIWRWDGEMSRKPKNLIVAKWLPQFQILSHKNLKAFISHAGLNSVTEATYNGVPVILMPLFADQDYNGYRVEAAKVGLRIEARKLTTSLLVNSLRTLLNDPKFSTNMKRLSAMMKDRPEGMNPIQSGVFWTEFVLRHDDVSALKPLQYLPWYQRRQLDIFVVLLITLSSFISIVLFTCYYTCKQISFIRESRLKSQQTQIFNKAGTSQLNSKKKEN